jgi:L-aminopeptidase/D-esterase-like protein
VPVAHQEETLVSHPSRRSFLLGSAVTACLGVVPAGAIELAEAGAITDVAGISVGHFTETRRPTGCTVILLEGGATAGVDVGGGAPGTRETDILNPANTVQAVHAILLTGGSAFGLDAASGVVRYLEERGIGYLTRAGRVPLVPSAVLYDLSVGDSRIRPDAEAGHKACQAALRSTAEGNIGAGTGATVGKLYGMDRAMKAGLGTSSIRIRGQQGRRNDDLVVGALAAVNAVGDVYDPSAGKLIAGARTPDGRRLLGSMAAILRGEKLPEMLGGTSTVLAIVATDAALTKTEATRVAQMAQDGIARTINPSHTPVDGDTVFTVATGRSARPANLILIGALAAEAVAQAVLRGVRAARGLPGLPSASDLS